MVHNNKEVLDYWNSEDVESMYDKCLISAEIQLIISKITDGSKILDAGCGEGEGTMEYAKKPDTIVHAVDFSETRLEKAKSRLSNFPNVELKKVDFLGDYFLDNDYDFIISQRFLINLMEWELQKKVILDLVSHLKPGGKLLMFEGSEEGVNELNELREMLGLVPIGIKWHNLFFNTSLLENFISENSLKILEKDGLGEFFFLTRGIRPYFETELNWNNPFNVFASNIKLKESLNFREKYSRLVLWVIEK